MDALWPSDSQDVEDEGENSARDDYVHDASDDRFGRRVADRRRAVAALKSAQASGDRDDDAVDGGLEDAAEDIRERYRSDGFLDVGADRDVQHRRADEGSASDAEAVGVNA